MLKAGLEIASYVVVPLLYGLIVEFLSDLLRRRRARGSECEGESPP